MAEAAGAGVLVTGAVNGAGDAATLGTGVVPALLPWGAGKCPVLRGRGGPLSDMWRLPLPWYRRWKSLRRQLRILLFHVSNVEPSGSCVANSGLSREKTCLNGCRAPADAVFSKTAVTAAASVLSAGLAACFFSEERGP